MNDRNENLTIGTLARTAGVNVETVRFYQRRGLLAEPDKPYGGIRRYGAADVARLRFIKTAQRLGFSLDDIAGLLRLADGTQCAEARVLAEHKLREVRARLADLARLEAVLTSLVDACIQGGDCGCPLIEALRGPRPVAVCKVSPT
ncbi:MAG: Hg(II)-responsive transcriptional regulator [Phenylobacterium sp.]|nr:Hg(II)-responsive transcriptional regulator [Phenylobacterium sp.]